MHSGVEAVLLYYAYRDLRDSRDDVRDWFEELCRQQGLVGRARIAFDGLNATLGGSLSSLQQHIAAVEARFGRGGAAIDFKLAESSGPTNTAMRAQSGFDRLSVQTCKEVVSLGVSSWLPIEDGALPAGARHVEPAEFHAMLEEAAEAAAASESCSESSCGQARETVLIDTRNFYETQIGRFEAPGVEVLDPGVRCFADTPAWLEANQHRLANKRVMMYCTGGVRCERASAYLMSLGSCFQDVVQLKGGIQRYLEAFPSGGFFRGANFVFDERGGVDGGSGTVVGRCVSCQRPWPDYRHRRRCASCRMLLLVCDGCAAASAPSAGEEEASNASSPALEASLTAQAADNGDTCDTQQQQQHQQQQQQQQQQLICELCVRRQQQQQQQRQAGSRKLRILCLHGFRQSAKNFEGRTHSLRRRLRDVADFVFVDAPHQLPAWSKAPCNGSAEADEAASDAAGLLEGGLQDVAVEGRQPGLAEDAELAAHLPPLAQGEEGLPHAQQQAAPHQQQQLVVSQPLQQRVGPPRRGWLLTPEQYASLHQEQQQLSRQGQEQGQQAQQRKHGQEEQQAQQQQWGLKHKQKQQAEQHKGHSAAAAAAAYVDEWQYQAQTAGWAESEQHLAQILEQQGPFDGVLGFSQGAAVAAVLAAQQCMHERRQQQAGQRHAGSTHDSSNSTGSDAHSNVSGERNRLRFAILCSGYRSAVPEHRQVLEAAAAAGGAALPTLHIYGSGGDDRQIGFEESVGLADCFDPTQRFVVRHSAGHIIPVSKAVLGRLRDFLAEMQLRLEVEQAAQQANDEQQQQAERQQA